MWATSELTASQVEHALKSFYILIISTNMLKKLSACCERIIIMSDVYVYLTFCFLFYFLNLALFKMSPYAQNLFIIIRYFCQLLITFAK